jgi:hypothetical protein
LDRETALVALAVQMDMERRRNDVAAMRSELGRLGDAGMTTSDEYERLAALVSVAAGGGFSGDQWAGRSCCYCDEPGGGMVPVFKAAHVELFAHGACHGIAPAQGIGDVSA